MIDPADANLRARSNKRLCIAVSANAFVVRLSFSDDLKESFQRLRAIVAMPCNGQVAHHSSISKGSIDDPLRTQPLCRYRHN